MLLAADEWQDAESTAGGGWIGSLKKVGEISFALVAFVGDGTKRTPALTACSSTLSGTFNGLVFFGRAATSSLLHSIWDRVSFSVLLAPDEHSISLSSIPLLLSSALLKASFYFFLVPIDMEII